ncbi:MAG: hypothetical protein ACE1Z8_05200, partial [Candidatus Acidiferrales bacterium]
TKRYRRLLPTCHLSARVLAGGIVGAARDRIDIGESGPIHPRQGQEAENSEVQAQKPTMNPAGFIAATIFGEVVIMFW